MNRIKKIIVILPIVFLLLLISPLQVEAAKKVDYVETKVFGGTNSEIPWSLTLDSSNNVYTTGFFQGTVDFDPTGDTDNHTSNGSYDVFMTKTNSDGTYGYTKTFGGTGLEYSYGVTVDSSNNIYVTGQYQGIANFNFTGGTDNHTSNGSYDIFVTKITSNGTYGYTKTFGGTGYDFGYSVVTDNSNNIYVTGQYQGTIDFDFTGDTDNHTSNGVDDIFITKLNSDGTYGYTKTFGGTGYDIGNSLAIDSSNNSYVTGCFEGTVDFDFTGGTDNHTSNGSYDMYLLKMNSDGTYGYTKTFGGTGVECGYSLAIDSSNNFYVTGWFESTVDFDFTGGTDNHTSNGSRDIFITKINFDGTYGYTKTFGGTSAEYGYSLTLDSLNNIYVTGDFGNTVDFDPGAGVVNKTTNSAYDFDSFVLSLKNDGSFSWVKTFSSNEGSDGYGLGVSNNKIYVTGDFGVTTDFNPDGPSDIITTDPNWSAYLTTYQLYFSGVTTAETSGTTSIVPNVSTDTVTVKLDAEPDSNVTVTLGSNDGSLVYSPSSLTFTSANYSTPQTVTISSATPVGANTTKNMTFTLTSSDTDYNGLTVTPLSVGVNVDNSDTVVPSRVVITNLGNISNLPNKDILRYFFTSQTPLIKGTSEANSTVYYVVNGHTYSTTTGSDGKYTITISNPSLLREKNVIVYYAKDSYFNKSAERTLELTVGEENFPENSSSSSSSSSTSSETSSSSSSSSTYSLSSSSTSSASSSSTSSIEVIEITKEITIKDENGNVLKNTVVIINGKSYTTDSKGKVKAEVAGVYIIEYDKLGVKYASTIKSNESIATLKKINQPNYVIPILVVILLLIIGVFILLIVLKKRSKSGENATF